MLAQFQRRAKLAYEKSASFACEATSAIRTVASLTREEDVIDIYTESSGPDQEEPALSFEVVYSLCCIPVNDVSLCCSRILVSVHSRLCHSN